MSILSKIKTGIERKPPIIVVHGPKGSWKTQMAVESLKPLLLQTEDGLGNRDIPRINIKSPEDLFEAIKELGTTEHDYRTLCIDSLDHLAPMIARKICADADKPNLEAFGFGKGAVLEEKEWQKIMDWLIKLRDTKNMAILLIAHSITRTVQDPLMFEPYERVEIKLPKKVGAYVCEKADIIGCAKERVTVVDNAKTGTQRAVGQGGFLLHINQQPSIEAKNRYKMQGPIDMNWNALMSAFATANKPKE